MTTKILIIENELTWLNILKKHLNVEQSFEISTVSSKDEAIASMRNTSFDVIVSDLQLVDNASFEKQIFETLAVVASAGKDIPIVVVTGEPISEFQLIDVINSFPGAIYGWHEKNTTYRQDRFITNIKRIVEKTQEKEQKKAKEKKDRVAKIWQIFIILSLSAIILAVTIYAILAPEGAATIIATVFVPMFVAMLTGIYLLINNLNN